MRIKHLDISYKYIFCRNLEFGQLFLKSSYANCWKKKIQAQHFLINFRKFLRLRLLTYLGFYSEPLWKSIKKLVRILNFSLHIYLYSFMLFHIPRTLKFGTRGHRSSSFMIFFVYLFFLKIQRRGQNHSKIGKNADKRNL